ncbi:MAG TPA: filamentous hemagglutinin family protein [Chthoniobacter sp.]
MGNRHPWRPSVGLATGILAGFLAAVAHAGDLLRGGATAGKSSGAAAPQPGAAAAAAAKANAADILSRTTQALRSVQALQNAANNLSQGANSAGMNLPAVPNGLAKGGLQVTSGATPGSPLWQGANLPAQSQSGGTTYVNITQFQPQAILTWETFNIGSHTKLQFDQDLGGSQSSQWIAYNIVTDPSGVPSQILGSIQANGQVFVINRNGIIFGGASQVNTHALYASSLPINGNLITSGLLANPDQQYLFSALPIPAGANGTPAFTPPSGGTYGDVTVEAGANITAPANAASVGGRVVLVGPNVTNNGTINTPNGQTILAAGLQVGLDAHPSSDPSLRGLDAYVGAITGTAANPVKVASGTSGMATNNGIIQATEGDVMITGANVNQNGIINSSTSVTLNGRVDLLADYNATTIQNQTTNLLQLTPQSTGAVNFGPGSVTMILPEWSSTATNVGTQVPLPSQVIVEGLTIHMGPDAILLAPGATPPPNSNDAGSTNPALDLAGQSMTSGVNFIAGNWFVVNNTNNLVSNSGQILIDSGAVINVAGSTDVQVPMNQNILSVALRGTELADSPTQREAIVRGLTIQADLRNTGVYGGQYWVGTPLANLTGYVGLIQKGVGQLSVDGGTVSLSSGGSVIVQSGATINVSGGYINYGGGTVQTTRLMTNSGYVMDISQATPDQEYLGVYTGRFTTYHPAWGVANQFSNPLALTGAHYEQSYVQGGNGGTLSITAPSMALDGTLLGNTVTGSHQLRTTSSTDNSTSSDTFSTSATSSLPAPSSLNLSFLVPDTAFPAPFPNYSPTPPDVIFESGITLTPASPTSVDSFYRLTGERATTVVLSPALLTQDGFGNLTVDDRDGKVTIPAGVSLKAPPQGSITLYGANMYINGNVSAPGGKLTFKVFDISNDTLNAVALEANPTTPPPDPTRGNFILGSGATLSTAGSVVDDREGVPGAETQPLVLNGGSITINSYNTNLLPGTTINVSGGVEVGPTGRRSGGNGGSITVTSGQDLNISSVLGGALVMDAQLKGFAAGGGSNSIGSIASGGGNGGSLSIQTSVIQIGGLPGATPGALYLSPQFFSEGGFASFTLTALGAKQDGQFLPAITITPGTIIEPVVQSEIASTSAAGINFIPVTEPIGIRTPVNLTFNAAGVSDKYDSTKELTRGDFLLGAGAAIITDPLSTVTINSETATILGSVVAPGGSIKIATILSPALAFAQQNNAYPLPNLDLGPQSLLSTAGTVVLLPDVRGYLTGTVLPGGTISLSGNIVAEAGSVINVSGTTGILDLPPAESNESTPLFGALSGQVVAPSAHMPAAPYNGSLVPNLPTATTTLATYVESGSFAGTAVVPTRVDSNGGAINLTGTAELFSDATLLGQAGGPAAEGGTLSVSSGGYVKGGGTAPPTAPVLSVTQSGPTIPVPFYAAGQTAVGHPVVGANGVALAGGGYFAVDSFLAGGFDNLTLGAANNEGMVVFNGPVNITARGSITVATGGLLSANSTVNLSASYVDLGLAFQPPLAQNQIYTPVTVGVLPTFGPGQLSVNAQLIDIGDLSLQNISQATFNAINGDIRGDGTLDVAGAIVMRAGQIYPATEVNFTIDASDYTVGAVTKPGSVTILPGGTRQLPLSAGGTLDVYGSIINQGGTLVAPLGSINIGWDGTGSGPVDPITGKTVAVSKQITLTSGSVTSVSATDLTTGQGVTIPYGINVNGTSWIDPAGTDITADLVPQKSINIDGVNVTTQAGSTISVQGGGDLTAYQWVSGTGGTSDILSWNYVGAWGAGTSYKPTQIVSYKGSYYYATNATTTESTFTPPTVGPYWNKVTPSYAVIPGYQADFAPYGPFNAAAATAGNNADQGYVNNTLAVGDQIYLGATPGLRAGYYTLLPARYALLPGAFLVTPQSNTSVGNFTLTDNSNITSGYLLNNLDQSKGSAQLYTTVAVASTSVFNQRASYTVYSANEYLATQSQVLGLELPRLPTDAGGLVLSGSASLTVDGNVDGQGANGGRGAEIDLSTNATIVIGGPGGSAPVGETYLNATLLNSYGAESILIGGTRQVNGTVTDANGTTVNGTVITVNTPNIIVNNAGAPLIAPEIILVATGSAGTPAKPQGIIMDPGAEIIQEGSIPQGGNYPNQPLLIGNPNVGGSGDGVLLRVGATSTAVDRFSVDQNQAPSISIGAGVTVSGQNVAIDSTAGGFLSPTATITGQNISISAGAINILLNQSDTPVQNGINIGGKALSSLLGTSSLSLTGYNTIDIYGSGTIDAGNLSLHSGSLRGFTDGVNPTDNVPDEVVINAASLTLDNAGGQTGLGPNSGTPIQGSLVANVGTLSTGAGTLTIDQYGSVTVNASSGVVLKNTGGITSQTDLTITAPIIIGAAQASQTITAQGGPLDILAPAAGSKGSTLASSAGLGATLNLVGQGLTENSRIYLPSGQLNLSDTSAGGVGVMVGGTLDVSGSAVEFYDTIQYTPGGSITISSTNGSVALTPGSTVSVAAAPGGGNAGSVSISAPTGNFTLDGTLLGQGGAGGAGGSFSADFSPGSGTFDITKIDDILNTGGFTQSRTYRVRTGDVTMENTGSDPTDYAEAFNYTLSVDAGSITVESGAGVDASFGSTSLTGGSITLVANGSVTLNSGALLSVAAKNFDDAGEGGSVTLEAGSETNGVVNMAGAVNIATGSTINLSVANEDPSAAALTNAQLAADTGLTLAQVQALTSTQKADLADQLYGEFTGTLHVRSPQLSNGTGFAINPIIDGTIINPSNIIVEGYHLITLTGANATITSAVQGQVLSNGNTFTAGTSGLYSTLLANASDPGGGSLSSVLEIVPGEEIINLNGNLVLGTSTSNSSSDWNLSNDVFDAPKDVPGVLTLRASGNLVFYNTLSDGFQSSSYSAALSAANALLPANAQSWSYNLTAGADLSAANALAVLPLAQLEASGAGSLLLGKNYGTNSFSSGPSATTSTAATSHYQVIRTGSGYINISAGIDVQLLNELATIYTAGTIVTPNTSTTMTLPDGSTFDIPILNASPQGASPTGTLGGVQNPVGPVQYSLGGGNVTITAQGDIAHYTTINGTQVEDSSKQLPNDWLYRRGYVDSLTGQFGVSPNGEFASTTWWVDFTDFFEGVGALGGGNITMIAGGNVSNVDGLIPTNARMPIGTPNAGAMVELGGGDLVVKAGGDINAGVYYVERGTGTLTAGNSIVTNQSRSPSLQYLDSSNPSGTFSPDLTWLPTTLFLGGNARNGAGGFTVYANNSVLLGPVANVFLLPEGYNNTFLYKTYFSTFAPSDYANVTSLSGDVTLRETTTDPDGNSGGSVPILQDWIENVMLLANPNGGFYSSNVSYFQPWLRIDETSTDFLDTALNLQPPTLNVTAFSGSINLQGNITLTPAPTGNVSLLAANAINALQPNGIEIQQNADGTSTPITVWETATINVSDANPASVYGITNPFGYQTVAIQIAGSNASKQQIAKAMLSTDTNLPFFSTFDNLFAESGQTAGTGLNGLDYGSVLTQEDLHDPGLLHANDPNPVRLYTLSGDISGLTLFSGKRAEILAGRDITDVGLYIQNVNDQDISVVSAGRDIIAYDAGSLLRGSTEAGAVDNLAPDVLSGDIQISGPGTLEVLAGRNLNLGNAPANATANADGIDLGVVSIGNARNPYLPFAGADIITAAGIGGPGNLSSNPNLNITEFISQYLNGGSNGSSYLQELGLKSSDISSLPKEQQAEIAVQVFFLILRDAGRAHTAGTGSYSTGLEAISKLFGTTTGVMGNVSLTSREIETVNGGNIQILAPNGDVTVGFDVIGQALDQGIITADGGNINILANGDVSLGTSRIFTLRGGNIIIWSSNGSIAAGSASKTVKAAPPTRVLIDPASADVKTDLAGLATGGGIGVLATVAGVPPGDVDLIAPLGVVDAGDAGIRATGNLNIAATKVLNADNISVSGTSSGTPAAAVVATPNVAGLSSASAAAASVNQSTSDVTKAAEQPTTQAPEPDSTITVEVVGYGGGGGDSSTDSSSGPASQ